MRLLNLFCFAVLAAAHIPQKALGDLGTHLGSDASSDPATIGYLTNHICLNVRNLTASIEFYNSVFGFRTLFTVRATPSFYVAYLGHAHGGHNGTGYQTTAEMIREKNNAAGLLEMIYFEVNNDKIPSSSDDTNTFSHIGIVVPDIKATQARLDAIGNVDILKAYGDDIPRPDKIGKMGNAFGLNQHVIKALGNEYKDVEKSVNEIVRPFIMIADPDGNIIEIQPQNQ